MVKREDHQHPAQVGYSSKGGRRKEVVATQLAEGIEAREATATRMLTRVRRTVRRRLTRVGVTVIAPSMGATRRGNAGTG
jgi:hypothetical protein